MSSATVQPEAPSRVPCTHCGLPAPAPAEDQTEAFCCHGCKGAWELIQNWGLEEYYELRDAPGEEVGDESNRNWDDLDDPRLLGRSAPMAIDSDAATPLLRSTLSLSGMHCAACLWLIERTPERVVGWQSAHVDMNRRRVEIVFDPTKTKLSEIGRVLHRIGYSVEPLAESTDDGKDAASRQLLVDLALAGFCAANAMWIAIALYAGQFTGMAASHEQFLRIAGVGLGVAAVVFPGRVFFRSAIASLRTRTPHMDLPVAVGLLAGTAASIYALFDLDAEVYFDSIACLVFFLLTGRWLQMRQQRRAGAAVEALMRLSPTIATRVNPDGSTSRVAAEQLDINDQVLVRPGESIPIDGNVVQGESMIDRSLMTGESFPVRVTPNDPVEAGTENLQTDLILRVTALGEETRLAGLQRAVADAAASRTPIIQLANRIGAWFVVVVLLLAIITAAIWFQLDRSQVLGNVVALLIVACPCALALATPLAIAVSIGRLAKRHVLVRSGDCLERLARPGRIFFDKTGTLTEGRMRVTEWSGDPIALRAAGQIELQVRHPIAQAISQFAEIKLGDDFESSQTAINVEQAVGRGVSGQYDGGRFEIGSMQLLNAIAPLDDAMQTTLDSIVASGSSPVIIIDHERCRGVFGVSDPIRGEAKSIIRWLQERGWSVGILSGDYPSAVARVAKSLSIDDSDAKGGLLPQEKLDAIRAATGDQPVIMVGDGVNDAAALAAADVGVAVRGGASASLAAAPVVIDGGSLKGVQALVEGAKQTRRTIGRNFAISISYNVVAVGMAIAGWINPLVAAALMPASSLTVLGLTLASQTGDSSTKDEPADSTESPSVLESAA